jgi:hypothetical protein
MYHIKNPESDLRSGRLEARNEKRGKSENIKEGDRKKKTNFPLWKLLLYQTSVYRGIIHLSYQLFDKPWARKCPEPIHFQAI